MVTQRSPRQTQVFPVIADKAELNGELINFARVYLQWHFSVAAVKKTSTTGRSVFTHSSGALQAWRQAPPSQAHLKGMRCNDRMGHGSQ